jgi:hypothetical protein
MNSKLVQLVALIAAAAMLSACERTNVVNPPTTSAPAKAPSPAVPPGQSASATR